MQATATRTIKVAIHENAGVKLRTGKTIEPRVLTGWQKKLARYRVRFHIFLIALRSYRSLSKARKALLSFLEFNRKLLGDKGYLKIVQHGSKYYYGMYSPAFPSAIFDDYIKSELNRIIPIGKPVNALSFIFFAITRKCPLQCEHCFEWEHLNKKETFTLDELKKVVRSFQEEGVSQFHFSGGEPLVRMKDLVELIAFTREKSECWILTSGFNLTRENAIQLRNAGATGVVISLDHYDPARHNAFRGMEGAHEWVLKAIQNARDVNLLVAVTICVTREFISWENLMHYTEYARSLGVKFIQLLEPKAVGHYSGKQVTLNWNQMELLEKFYTTLNYDPQYSDYPVILYHGFHQRRMGCMSAGNRNIYIDSAGYVNSCPFCQTRDYNIRDTLLAPKKNLHDAMSCPLY